MLRWIKVLRISSKMRHHPASVTTAERVYQKFLIAKQLEGFVAVADAPCYLYAEILMDLYPDAKIIVTTRDEGKWWQSIAPIIQKSKKKAYTNILFFWVPGLRHWAEYIDLVNYDRCVELYNTNGESIAGPYCYSWHIDYLERVISKEKLHYYDIKTGWGPLCEILQLPIPEVDFPFENDAMVIQSAFKKAIYLGLGLWACFLTGVAATAMGVIYATRHRLTFASLADGKVRALFSSS
jgi:hypothetical protein